jgi:hypothetical protein
MSDFGSLASRLNDNTNVLRKFDAAIRYFKDEKAARNSLQTSEHTERLLYVLKPVSETLNGILSKTISLDEQKIAVILKQRRLKDWQHYHERVNQLTSKLASRNTSLTRDDFEILNDIADAIDTECANLFRRMSGRP